MKDPLPDRRGIFIAMQLEYMAKHRMKCVDVECVCRGSSSGPTLLDVLHRIDAAEAHARKGEGGE